MKSILSLALFCILFNCLHAQPFQTMGIGNLFPDTMSILDIKSTSKGILIPRLSNSQRNAISNLGNAQNGMLIYNTSTDSFNYWNGSSWIEFPDSEWTDAGDLLYPADGNNEEVAIGTTSSQAKLTVYQSSFFSYDPAIYSYKSANRSDISNLETRSFFNLGGQAIKNKVLTSSATTSQSIYAISNDMNSVSSNGSIIGVYNEMDSSTSGASITAVSNQILNNPSTGTLHGVYNDIGGIGTASKYGSYSNFQSNSIGTHFASYNHFNTNIIGNQYGMYNQFEALGTDTAYAIYNQFENNGNSTISVKYGLVNNIPSGSDKGETYGVQNNFLNSSFGNIKAGVDNRFEGTGSMSYGVRNNFDLSGKVYGMHNQIDVDNSSTVIGMQNDFTSTSGSGGIVSGTATTFNSNIGGSSDKSGHTVYFGDNLGGDLDGYYAFYNDASTTSYKHGFRVDMNNADNGQNYGVRVDITGSTSSNYGVFSSVTSNGYSGYFNGNMYVTPSIGISILNPSYNLHMAGNSAAKPVSSSWFVISDRRLKEYNGDFNDGLDMLMQIDPIWFTHNGKGGIEKGLKGVGLMAQDLQKLAPYMVNSWKHYPDSISTERFEEYLAIDYGAMDFIMINAIKEQQEMISKQQSLIEENKKFRVENAALKNTLKDVLERLDKLEKDI